MSSQPFYFPLQGGMDQETPPVAIKPGRAIACLNHEACATGYARTQGFDRYDGRPAPHEAEFYVGTFSTGAANMVGMAIEGATSGATGIVVEIVIASGSIGAGTAAGTIVLGEMSGTFSVNEYIMGPGDVAVARVVTPPSVGDKVADASSMARWKLSRERRRSAMGPPPGAGPVRGVFWFEGALHAFRDNPAGTEGLLHKQSVNGWYPMDLGMQMTFTSGGPAQIANGDTISGDVSGAVATVRTVGIDGDDDWDSGEAIGTIIFNAVSGAFQVGETVSVGATLAIATVASVGDVTLPPGGMYEFIIHNFYGTVGTERVYGVNGVGKGFEFDGENLSFITTGMPEDQPILIAEHKKHLFFGFRRGSLQNSAQGSPRVWSAILGAAEMGMGKELTAMIPNTSDAMFITTEGSCHVLTGNDVSDFLLQDISSEAGARYRSVQRIGNIVYMDEEGIRSASSTQTYGNFKLGSYTSVIEKTLKAKRKAGVDPIASAVIKGKSQYVLFFRDGTGITLFMARKTPEPMTFEYPIIVTCVWVALIDGYERVFAGSDAGMVYELNVGTTFDGGAIDAMVQLAYGHQDAPRVLKRYHKVIVEMEAGPVNKISVIPQFDYGSGFQTLTLGQWMTIRGGGGAWGLATWGDFYWDSAEQARAECPIDGSGESISPVLFSGGDESEGYTFTGAWIMYSGRGMKR